MNNRMTAREPAVCDPALVEKITEELVCSALTARALIRRGVSSAEEARRFIEPDESALFDPQLLPDMEKAVARVRTAIESKEKICVFGDYDADGVCSTAMLVNRFRAMGADVEYHIPHRQTEGYGMTESAVRSLKELGVGLIVTVDNGITAYDEVALCGALGIDVVVTDHHSVGSAVPDCAAVVAASRKDSSYPNRYLCGAGVALKLIQAVCGEFSNEELALAAVATVADVVPLTEENRAIVSLGLRHIKSIPGITALLRAAGYQQREPDETTISFVIAPRLNAAGRMHTAMDAVKLLLGDDETAAEETADALNGYNQERRDTENEILEDAEHQIADLEKIGRVVILKNENWNAGVTGIVASRLCDKLHLPVILFAGQNGMLTGSGRSIEGVDLFENLTVFSHLFVRYGGHARAAGVTIEKDKYESFKESFTAHIEANYNAEDFYPEFQYDETAGLSELTVQRVKELRRLAPFGEGNPEPVYRFNCVRFSSLRTIGKDDRHFCASAVQKDRVMRVVAFGKSELLEALATAEDWDLLARPAINAYRGSESVELFWICANASEEKVAFFNAFFAQKLYNEDCSEDEIEKWLAGYGGNLLFKLDDASMRKHYRTLLSAIDENEGDLVKLIRILKSGQLLALCVFTQLSFFSCDEKTNRLRRQIGCTTRPLEESSLYRIATKTLEA